MILAIVTVTVAQLLDLATFVRMVTIHGPVVEANPIVRSVLLEDGLPAVIVAKLAALSLVVAVVAALAGRSGAVEHRRLVAAVVAIAIVAGLVGGWSNTLVLL